MGKENEYGLSKNQIKEAKSRVAPNQHVSINSVQSTYLAYAEMGIEVQSEAVAALFNFSPAQGRVIIDTLIDRELLAPYSTGD